MPIIKGNNKALLLVDIENLIGSGDIPSPEEVLKIKTAIEKAFANMRFQTVVACSHRNASSVWFQWPNARKLLGSGPDGADLKLISVLEDEPIIGRYHTVIIASGDHIFANPLSHLAGRGLKTIVAVGQGSLSKKLQIATHEIVDLQIEINEDLISA